ncbi:MAG: hypothetical protein A3F74_11225 [Betaproteobacteria bacterium RIFCSPLOWO2_12_FULL_62_58]|nr:MAG: hypothetical protein A3F74_11225 [Betaproteobacteria bacterium RIFCSPLOWO2_12_FULL_62_58]
MDGLPNFSFSGCETELEHDGQVPKADRDRAYLARCATAPAQRRNDRGGVTFAASFFLAPPYQDRAAPDP